jgi:hypothetical protein
MKLCMGIDYITGANMAAVRDFEFMFEKRDVHRMCTSFISSRRETDMSDDID